MPDRDAQFDRKLAAIFRAEAAEHVQRMQESLAQLEGGAVAPGAEALTQLFRATHSLKGAARAVGQDEVEVVCHATEGLLSSLQRGRLAWSAAIGDVLHEVVAGLARLQPGAAAAGSLVALLPRLERLEWVERSEDAQAPPRRAPSPSAAPAPALPQAPAPAPAPAPRAAAAPAPAQPDAEQTVRIGVEHLGRLLHGAEELVKAKLDAAYRVAQLRETVASTAGLRAAALAAGGPVARAWERHEQRLRGLAIAAGQEQRQLASAVDGLLADVKKSLLLPVGAMRPFLVATGRELARSQGKDLELRIRGDEVEMDRRLLEELREPLIHLLRNAIGHGIEGPEQRAAAGKPARAVVDVAFASRNGGRLDITVADDGAGVDTQRLAEAARALHLPVADDAQPAELLPLVFGHGVSTAGQLTEVAGRGIGLAIVRQSVERLGGTIQVASTRGEGTTFTLSLPVSLATYAAVEVRASGRAFLLPTSRIESCRRFTAAQVRRAGAQPTVTLGEEELPLVSLASVLGLPPADAAPSAITCAIVGSGTRRIALAVDEVRGEQEVLGRPVDGSAGGSAVLAGAAVLGAGEVVPILNVPELVRTALREGGRRPAREPAPAARPRSRFVLLVEDSITSRTLLKNILELAGHRVDTAVDGAEALRKLREGGYEIVVSDVEMPNLDGIGLTQAIRRDKALAYLPVVLVTSLGSPRDRERGAEAGANAYIVKSSFDQGSLLQAIAELA